MGREGRARRTLRSRRLPVGLLVLLALGLVLRGALSAAYAPVVVAFNDSVSYLAMARGELFSSATHMAGYPAFLRVVHAVSDEISLTILVQHLLGMLTGVLLYAMTRRLGAPSWAGLVAAAAVLLSLDQIVLEHSLLTEALFTFLIVAMAYCAVASLSTPTGSPQDLRRRVAWLAAAGALLGLSAYVRSYSVLLIPCLFVWALVAFGGSWRSRLLTAGAGTATAVAVVLVYATTQWAMAGYFGLAKSSGWALYSRTAQFADCSEFTPPPGTRRLCEATPEQRRPGPDFYAWEPESPARRAFGDQRRGGEELSAFARAAVLNQPVDYLETVANDFIRYFAPGWNDDRAYAGVGLELTAVDRRAPGTEQASVESINALYEPVDVRVRGGVAALSDLQQLLRVQPLLLLQFVLLAGAGLWWARGPRRAAVAMLLGTSLLLMAVPPATAIYSARYALPVSGLLAAAAALGLLTIVERVRSRPPPSPEPRTREAVAARPMSE